MLTYQDPLAISYVRGQVPPFFASEPQVKLEPVVGPGPEFHLTFLVVEGEPCDVDFARTFEDSGRDVGAATVVPHYDIRGESTVDLFVGAASKEVKQMFS